MVYKHAYLNTLLLLHSTFMPSVVKMPLKGEVGIVMEITMLIVENHGIVFLHFCGNPVVRGHNCWGVCIEAKIKPR